MLKIKPSIRNNLDFTDEEEPITLIVDAWGLTISKKGHYIEKRTVNMREKKEFNIKLNIAIDEKSKKPVNMIVRKLKHRK